MNNHIIEFNSNALWKKIAEWSRKAGRLATRPVILLWYVMTDKNTPKADKMLVLSAISYLVLPVDFLDSKRLPLLGWLDEIISISVAFDKVCKHITPEMQARADALLDRWFPDDSFQPILSKSANRYDDIEFTAYEIIE